MAETDQAIFDRLFDCAKLHVQVGVIVSRPWPFETMVMAVLLEHEKRALTLSEQALGPDHPDTAISLDNLAGLYYAQGRYDAAEPLLQRALALYERVLGPDHPDTTTTRQNYTIFLQHGPNPTLAPSAAK